MFQNSTIHHLKIAGTRIVTHKYKLPGICEPLLYAVPKLVYPFKVS
jgi:hypothetical protein